MHPFLWSLTETNGIGNLIDLKLGPDGTLYSLGYAEHNRENINLLRLDYRLGNRSPLAVASASPDSGGVPLEVDFTSTGTMDPDSTDSVEYVWSFYGDGQTNSTEPNPTHTYTASGLYTPQLRVYDQAGNLAVANLEIVVGNNRPEVTILSPPNGSVYDWGEALRFKGAVTDLEDGQTPDGGVDCGDVFWELSLGHNDDHEHSLVQLHGCEGVVDTPGGHGSDGDHLFLTLLASYEDRGSNGVPSLSDEVQVILQPRRKQAEHYSSASDVQTAATADDNGLRDVTWIDDGDFLLYTPLNFTNVNALTLRVGVVLPGSRVELRLNSTTGPLIGTAELPATSGGYTNTTIPITDPGGTHALVLLFLNDQNPTGLCRVNWLQFEGDGITVNQPPYRGITATIPGRVEVERFDEGGNHIAHYDDTPRNLGGRFRDTEVDILRLPRHDCRLRRHCEGCFHCLRTARNFGVFATTPGEWLEYTVQVETQGVYEVNFRATSLAGGGMFHLEHHGVDVTGPLEVPGIFDWFNPFRFLSHLFHGGWGKPSPPRSHNQVMATNVVLEAGTNVLRLTMLEDGFFGTVGVFDRMDFRLVEAYEPEPQEPAVVTVATPPTLQACGGLGSPFEDVPEALVDEAHGLILVDRPPTSCFFRVTADRPVRITLIEIVGDQLRIRYE